jgi:RNA polymerase sigma-70 factor, ECF subfamily
MRSKQDTPEQRFDWLYRTTSDDVFAYLLRRARTTEDAADALAETYAAAWRKLESLPEGDRARLWVFGAARNELRKAAARLRADDGLASALARDLPTASRDNSNCGDRDDAMRDALLTLSRIDYEIVTLTAWEELTPREIAAILGLSANVVRIRLHRARGNLRALLQREQRLEMRGSPAAQHSGGS